MQLFGGKKKGRHSAGAKGPETERQNRPPEVPAAAPEGSGKAPGAPREGSGRARFSPLAAPAAPEALPRAPRAEAHDSARGVPRAEAHDSARGEPVGAEPRFAADEYVSREERRASKKWLRTAALVLAAVLALGAGGYAWFQSWARPVDIASDDPTRQTQQPQDSGGDVASPAPTVEGMAPAVAGSNRRDDVYTFLISGLDREGLHTDTNIVGMFDIAAGELNFVNIPRDTLINIPGTMKKMNIPYPAAVNNGQDATEALLDAVEKLVGYRVDCYAIVDIMAVEEIVDAIGGVWYDIPFDMDYDAPDQTPEVHIHIPAGYQLLDGENFVNAMRFRISNDGSQTYVGGDIERIAFQQKLLYALAEQTISLGNIPNLGKIYDIYENRVETAVSVRNLAYFAQEFLKMDMANINFMTIPNKPDAVIYEVSYVTVYIDEWIDMINEYLNPFTVEITRENLDMISFDGANWDMTQGYIAGGEYSFANAWA